MTSARAGPLVSGATFVLVGLACKARTEGSPSVGAASRWSAPSDDVGDSCADVGDLRVCWSVASGPRVIVRPVPPFASPTPPGFRCTGAGANRTCEPCSLAAGPFECALDECAQSYPRQPDDGQWSCADDAGITVCVGSSPAAGVAMAGGVAPGWACGPRRPGAPASDRLGPQVCVDLSPDFPEGRASGFRCRWSYDHGVRRLCTRDIEAHVVGDGCDPARPCVRGAVCVAARCVPQRAPVPACWLDADCGGRSCQFGSCTGEPP